MFFFGNTDDSIQNTALKVSLFGTLILWVLFLLTAVFIPDFSKKEEFSAINIILDPPPEISQKENDEIKAPEIKEKPAETVENTNVSKPVPQQQETSKIQETKPEVKPETKTETKPAVKPEVKPEVKPDVKPTQPKTEPQKPSASVSQKPVPAPSETQKSSVQQPATTQKTDTKENPASAPRKANITYKKSLDELMEEQQAGSVKKPTEFDDSLFGDDNYAETQTSSSPVTQQKQTAISGASAFEGTSAVSSGGAEKAIAKTDTASVSQTTSQTSSSLAAIASVVPIRHNYTDGISDESKVEMSKTSDGKTQMKMLDGSSRILLEPSKPSIMISPENAGDIDNKRTVRIVFKVLPSGNVSDIEFKPASLLPVEIQAEIREQILRWRFSTGPTESQAQFEYSIIKR